MGDRPRMLAPAWVLARALILGACIPAAAQTAADESAASAAATPPDPQAQARLLLALSTPDYPVTPGDTYVLSFSPAVAALGSDALRVSEVVVVGSDYTINLGVFGSLVRRGLRFNELRGQVLQLVQEAYPSSNPALLMTRIGAFEVHVRGEVDNAAHVATWGLGRLSRVLAGRLTRHASIRDVRIKRDGATMVFDLFQAQRYGIRSQDPYLAPGDRICVSRLQRSVTIRGQVRRPGTYQLLAGERLAELLVHAGGFTPRADLERVRIDTLAGEPAQVIELPADAGAVVPPGAHPDCDGDPVATLAGAGGVGTTRYAAWDARLAREPLRDGDVVVIADRDALLPVVFFEGAVGDGADDSGRLTYRFRPGQTLFAALQEIRRSVAGSADLRNGTFVRVGAPGETIDLDRLLHGGSRAGDRELQPLDRIIIPPHRFEVALRGEVTEARQLTVGLLTRLNDVVEAVRTPYTSIRRIVIEWANGPVRTYDLFRWLRFGEIDHNPLLRPGGTITFQARGRAVHVGGEVRRPGRYQLLAGEGLAELIEWYGEGLTIRADPTRVVIRRQNPQGSEVVAESITVDFTASRGPALVDEDSVAVHSVLEQMPVVYVEGAVLPLTDSAGEPLARPITTVGSGRRVAPYRSGATAYDVMNGLRDIISRDADLRAAYVARAGERIPVDLQRLVFGNARQGDLPLRAYDTIVIPLLRRFVTVAGAVNAPGVFRYVPDRSAGYYVGLAGGRDAERNDGSGLTLTDPQGREKASSSVVAPDDQIFVPTNSFLYVFDRGFNPLGAMVLRCAPPTEVGCTTDGAECRRWSFRSECVRAEWRSGGTVEQGAG